MGFFGNLFGGGGKNPADEAMPYLEQIPGVAKKYFGPYFDAGKAALGPLQEQYAKLLGDPGALMNKFGESYQQSPGFQHAMEQALMAGGHAAAAGGMAGTPQNQYQQMKMATDLANQDYNNWLGGALGLYGQGLYGQQGLAGMGLQAGQGLSDTISQALAQQGNLAFRGQQEQNAMRNSLFGGLGQLGGAALGGMAGGPWGAFAGWNMGR